MQVPVPVQSAEGSGRRENENGSERQWGASLKSCSWFCRSEFFFGAMTADITTPIFIGANTRFHSAVGNRTATASQRAVWEL